MRIVIDMQGAQSPNSRHRGIGRYTLSLVRGLLQLPSSHEFVLVLNGQFEDTLAPLREAFADLLPPESVRVWHAPLIDAQPSPEADFWRQAAATLRADFIASLQPDLILLSSVMEGWQENAVVTQEASLDGIPTAAVLYDLIPYAHPAIYLHNPRVMDWYERQLGCLRRCDLLLAISEASRQEALQLLALPSEQVSTISSAADACFLPIALSGAQRGELLGKYRLTRPYAMYTGGVDHRKNLDRLIQAYALLPLATREAHQLAIVCRVSDADRAKLVDLAAKAGLPDDALVLTGYVPEDDLVALYNLATVFVFPSWHEGFGLPVLEAMQCGCPVIASNRSSLPEVVGNPEALFDPYDAGDMARLLERALEDAPFRQGLIDHARQQAALHSWFRTAKAALQAMESMAAPVSADPSPSSGPKRPRLAYVSPLPPARSGISFYSAELLPALAKYYDIDVVAQQPDIADAWVREHCGVLDADQFIATASQYERVLYHVGNSEFHTHQHALLPKVPGVVVLHDFFLSGGLLHAEASREAPDALSLALYHSHGYAALASRYLHGNDESTVHHYPANLGILQASRGVIVHSRHACMLADQWYGPEASALWGQVPLPRRQISITAERRQDARLALGLSSEDFVVCSMGVVSRTKCTLELVDAWLASSLAQDPRCTLIVAGSLPDDPYGVALNTRLQTPEAARIRVTGWLDDDQFEACLSAADMAVQLRTLSRGETSAAVLDCLSHGLPTIVNANGSLAELPEDAVWMMPDAFSVEQLAEALTQLRQDEARRLALSQAGLAVIAKAHTLEHCASLYAAQIERHYRRRVPQDTIASLRELAGQAGQKLAGRSGWQLAEALNRNFPPAPRRPQILIDLSAKLNASGTAATEPLPTGLRPFLLHESKDWRVEPIRYCPASGKYRYARRATLALLGLPPALPLEDEIVDIREDDRYVPLAPPEPTPGNELAREHFEVLGRAGPAMASGAGQAIDDILASWLEGLRE